MKPTAIKRHHDTNSLLIGNALASFPAVVKPRLNDVDKNNPFYEYSVDVLIPKLGKGSARDDYPSLGAVMSDVETERWPGKVPDFRYQPIKDGDQKVTRDGVPYEGYEGHWYLTAKASEDNPPSVVNLNKEILTVSDAIVGGDVVNLFVSCYAYGKMGNNGIGWGLITIQLKEKCSTPFGGGVSKKVATDAFDQFNEDDLNI